ncbi:MAG: hypothetical protein KDA20_12295 [Phycisphaerales bacterium]|nr:hypothetical protein [Phycisphaerales bacterium]
MTTQADHRSQSPEQAASPQRLAALLLVAALLPAVVASWSAGPFVRVQTALVEASRAPVLADIRPAADLDEAAIAPTDAILARQRSAPVSYRLCEALRDRLDLCATPPPALA